VGKRRTHRALWGILFYTFLIRTNKKNCNRRPHFYSSVQTLYYCPSQQGCSSKKIGQTTFFQFVFIKAHRLVQCTAAKIIILALCVMQCWNGGGVMDWQRKKIRLIEGNAKCRHLKNWPVKWLCCRPRNPYSSPFHTVYVYTVYLITQRRGRGDGWTREKGRGATGESTDHKAGLTTWLTVGKKLAVNSDKTWRKVPVQVSFFKLRYFALTLLHWLLWVLSFYVYSVQVIV
jgi:hypothetical protein